MGEVRLDGRKIDRMGIQNAVKLSKSEVRVVGENNSSENVAILYDCVEFKDYLGNVDLVHIPTRETVFIFSGLGRVPASRLTLNVNWSPTKIFLYSPPFNLGASLVAGEY